MINLRNTALILIEYQTWHDVSSLGTTYLHGARSILKSVIANNNHQFDALAFRHASESSFLIGAVTFWEALSSFHLDQALSSLDYLDKLCDIYDRDDSIPNPWTGIHTKLFLLVAKVGTITRQGRSLARLITSLPSLSRDSKVFDELFNAATDLENKIRSYEIGTTERIKETCDRFTPVSHFEKMAQIYQTTALLELYQVFPRLLCNARNANGHRTHPISFSQPDFNYRHVFVALAINILMIFSSIPSASGTKAIQLLPLVIAGSALQDPGHDATVNQALGMQCINSATITMLSSKAAIVHWRSYVKTSLSTISQYVGLDSAERGTRIVEEVWLRADMQQWSQKINSEDTDFVYWADVMRDERLETLLG